MRGEMGQILLCDRLELNLYRMYKSLVTKMWLKTQEACESYEVKKQATVH